MFHLSRFLLILSALIALTQISVAFGDNTSKILVKVNGKPIHQEDLDNAKQTLISKSGGITQNEILDRLINQELVRQAIRKSYLKERSDVREAIEIATQDVLYGFFLQEEVKRILTEETLLNEYNEYIKMLSESREGTQPSTLVQLHSQLESRLVEKGIVNVFKKLRAQGKVELAAISSPLSYTVSLS